MTLYNIKANLAIVLIITLILFCFLVVLKYVKNNDQKFGIFDPQKKFIDNKNVFYELSYFSWGQDVKEITNEAEQVIGRGRIPVVTIEPWPFKKNDTDVLSSTLKSEYDVTIDTICYELNILNKPIIVRWGHEMEISSRYPWAVKDPELYKKSYVYFVEKCKIKNTNKKISFMWSPSGEDSALKYWPGSDSVDYIGVSVYSFDLWDIEHIGHKRSFREVFLPKYLRFLKYNKPIIIAEMGVTGTKEYKEKWLTDAFYLSTFCKKLVGYIYFNRIDVEHAWGSQYITPDWSIESIPLINIDKK